MSLRASLGILTSFLAAMALLAGCESAAPTRPMFPELTFSNLPPLNFDATRVEVVNEYVAPLKRPNVEHEMPLRPSAAAERWAKDRVKAAGNSNRSLRVTIKNARVVESELKKATGLRGMFTTDQAQRYDAELEMLIELRNDRGFREGSASAVSRRSFTVPEGITINDREKEYFKLVEDMMTDINRELERSIREHMAKFLR
jgi:hypothetical protein